MNQRKFLMISFSTLVVLTLIASNALFVISETQRAVMLRFGELIRPDIPAGLHIKMPIMHEIRLFDGRARTVDTQPERFLTKEKKFLEVNSFAQWRIDNVAKFYTSTNGEERRVQALLSQRINNGLRNQFGERTMQEVVSGQRDELMQELVHELDEVVQNEFGVELIDIRIKRIDLPPDVSESVYNRMNTERQREAREYRSEGRELAEGIRAGADREQIVIRANAYREAEEIRGFGDAESTRIYADSYNKDQNFYSFLRSLQAYRESFRDKSDLLIIKPESEFFRFLKRSEGK